MYLRRDGLAVIARATGIADVVNLLLRRALGSVAHIPRNSPLPLTCLGAKTRRTYHARTHPATPLLAPVRVCPQAHRSRRVRAQKLIGLFDVPFVIQENSSRREYPSHLSLSGRFSPQAQCSSLLSAQRMFGDPCHDSVLRGKKRHHLYACLFEGIFRRAFLRSIFERELKLHRIAPMQFTPQSEQRT